MTEKEAEEKLQAFDDYVGQGERTVNKIETLSVVSLWQQIVRCVSFQICCCQNIHH